MRVHTGAYAFHSDMIQAWKDWVCDIAEPHTAIDDELRDLADMKHSPIPIADVVEVGISAVDLIMWWEGRDDLNEVRFYEVQDRRK